LPRPIQDMAAENAATSYAWKIMPMPARRRRPDKTLDLPQFYCDSL
jgi:hypothetical protein